MTVISGRILKKKRKLFNEALLHELVTSVNNQKEFWNSVRKMSPIRKGNNLFIISVSIGGLSISKHCLEKILILIVMI